MWKLINTILNNHLTKEEIKKYLETNINKTVIHQNVQDAIKAYLRGKFRATNATLRKKRKILKKKRRKKEEKERSKIN